MTEWSFEDICELLDQARDCGVAGFQMTGGEPMAHRRSLDIVREIYKRDMSVFTLNTNGQYITQEVLGACMNLEKYYASLLDFSVEYMRSGMSMDVTSWQYIGLMPKERGYYLIPVKFPGGSCRDWVYCCKSNHLMAAITSSVEILPCNQMSGFFLKNAMTPGNVHRTPLRELLGGGDYVRYADMTVSELRGGSGKCAKCPHFDACGGGCRALGLLYSGCRGLTTARPPRPS